MSFTADEVQAAVSQLVASTIRRPYDTLGTRRVDVAFSDTQEAAAGVFLLYPKAPFYILSLGAQRLLELVSSEAEQVESLLQAVEATGRQVFPIHDISSLSNARSALFSLEGAVQERTSGFKDIEKVPAFVRYKANLEKFLLEAGSNVKLNGQVVQTPQQARKNLATLITTLKATHTEVMRLAKLLSSGMSDFSSVNLPSLVAQGVLTRARELLSAYVDEMQVLSPEARLENLRQLVLDLVAQKAVVKQFGSFTPPSDTLFIEGTGTPYSDATHLATPASLVLPTVGPFGTRTGRNIVDVFVDQTPVTPKVNTTAAISLVSGNIALFTSLLPIFSTAAVGDVIYVGSGSNNNTRWVVTLLVSALQVQALGIAPPVVDAAATIRSYKAPSVALSLASSFIAKLEGAVDEPYDINVGPPNNRFLTIDIDGLATSVTLTTGATRTADQVAADITAQNLGRNFKGEGYFGTLKYRAQVNITVPGSVRFTLLAGQLDGLGVVVGDQVKVLSGLNAGLLLTITAVDGSAPVTFVDAVGAAVVDTNALIEIGTHRRVRVVCTDAALALTNRTKLTATSSTTNDPGLNTLGIFPGLFSQTRPTTAREVLTDIQNQTAIITPSVSFSTTYLGLARTEPTAPSRVVFYKARVTATVTTALAGPSFAITLSVPAGGLLTAGVLASDLVVLREGSVPNAVYTITTVTDTQIIATGTVQASLDSDILVEVGPDLGTINYGMVVNVSSGPNGGDVAVASQNAIRFELELQKTWPIFKNGTQPLFMTNVSVGGDRIQLTSIDRTTASYVKVTEANTLFGAGQLGLEAFMTTPWFKLPSIPTTLDGGDLLELYASAYHTASATHEILSVDTVLRLIEVEPELGTTTWAFGDGVPPFAKLRAGKYIDFNGFKARLETWLAQAPQQAAFFTDLNRFINPLVVNTNPSAAQVNTARLKVLELAGYLTTAAAEVVDADPALSLEDILGDYEVPPVPPVDVLLNTLAERGADRAKDLLLEGQFNTFFSVTIDGSSYSGDVLERLRAVAQQDLPVRKSKRSETYQSPLQASADSPDFEFDTSDTETGVQPDPPVGGESIS